MSKLDDKSKTKQTTLKKNPLQGMNTAKLSNLRIIQKHLVYVIGLSSTLANKEVIRNK
jgi:CCR4-NOT transcription complex subunit 4